MNHTVGIICAGVNLISAYWGARLLYKEHKKPIGMSTGWKAGVAVSTLLAVSMIGLICYWW